MSPCDATCYPLVPTCDTCDRWHVMLLLTLTADMCTGDLNAVMLSAPMRLITEHMAGHHCFIEAASVELMRDQRNIQL